MDKTSSQQHINGSHPEETSQYNMILLVECFGIAAIAIYVCIVMYMFGRFSCIDIE